MLSQRGFGMSTNPFAQVILKSWVEIHDYSKIGWIYRGQRRVDWPLRTSLERCFDRHSIPQSRAREVESDLLREFRRAYHHYSQHVPSPTDIIEWLSIMKKHSLPQPELNCSVVNPFPLLGKTGHIIIILIQHYQTFCIIHHHGRRHSP